MKYATGLLLLVLSTLAQAQTLQVSPKMLTWYEIYPHDSASGKFSVTNPSGADIEGNFTGISDTFTIVGGKSFRIGPGATDSFTVVFKPLDLGGGYDIDSVLLVTPEGPPYAYVILHGHARNFSAGNIGLTPAKLDFGTLAVNTADTLYTVATNTGESPLKVSSLTVLNSIHGGGAFRLYKSSAASIPAKDSFLIRIIFKPINIGTFDDTCLVQTNDTTQALIRVPLHGVGIAASVASMAGENQVSIFPSVVSTSLTIHIGTSEGSEIAISDLLGREFLRMRPSSQETKLDLAPLPNGAYLCLVKNRNGVFTSRFIVSR